MSDQDLRRNVASDFPDVGMQAFRQAAAEMDLSLTPFDCDLAQKWFEFYSHWPGRRVIGFTDPKDVAVKLLADSFVPRLLASALPSGPVIDLGSGNGWPGLALHQAGELCLLDSRKGACDFMRSFVTSSSLKDVRVVEARAEDACKEIALAGHFGTVTSRAMASPAMALELGSPFVGRDGAAVLWLGPAQEGSVDVKPQIREIGLTLAEKLRYTLPGGMGQRALAVYRRTGKPLPGYPRKIPSIKAKPLL